MPGPYSEIRFWENQLQQGFRITGIRGSDNHQSSRRLAGVTSRLRWQSDDGRLCAEFVRVGRPLLNPRWPRIHRPDGIAEPHTDNKCVHSWRPHRKHERQTCLATRLRCERQHREAVKPQTNGVRGKSGSDRICGLQLQPMHPAGSDTSECNRHGCGRANAVASHSLPTHTAALPGWGSLHQRFHPRNNHEAQHRLRLLRRL